MAGTAATMPTLLDMVKFQGNDAVVGLIEEVISKVPELALLPARGIPGQSYKTLARVTLPSVGFRSANEGSSESKSGYEERSVETFPLNPSWKCDKMVADIHPDGAEAYIATEGAGMTKAAAMAVCKQMYYGRANDAKGFQGLANFVDSGMVVDATGSTANGATSVWAVKWGLQDVSLCFGANGNLDLSDVRIGDAYDANNKRYTAYIQELASWVGLSVLSKWSVGRICNLTVQSGKGLTDTLLSQLLEKFPEDPDCFIMTRQSRGQLQRSRTATNATGQEAPRPKDYEGIPIVVSESLVNTEAIVS